MVERETITSPVVYSIAVSSPITPAEPLPPLPAIPRGSLVIVEGRAPIWRYGMALHLLHGSPAAAQGSRSAPGCGRRGNAQPGVGRGSGGGCDPAPSRRKIKILINSARYFP